jgi:F-type H+-transporting ATPase subunit epsilon
VSQFNVAVLTPRAEVFSGPVDEVVAPGVDGDFGVLSGHYAYITAVQPGALALKSKAGTQVFAVGEGFAQVSADKVSLVLSSCDSVDGLSEKAANDELAASEKALLAATPGEPDFIAATRQQKLALAKLAALAHKRR